MSIIAVLKHTKFQIAKWLLKLIDIDHEYIMIIIEELDKRERVRGAIDAHCQYIESRLQAWNEEDEEQPPISISERTRPLTAEENGFTYFIFDEDRRVIKIGFSASPRGRLKELQTGNPTRLRIAATIWGSKRIEMQMHDRFSKDRISGEWFSLSDELKSYIIELRKRNRPHPPPPRLPAE